MIFFQVADIARALGVHRSRAYQIAEGLEPAAVTPGGRKLYDATTVEALLRRRRERRIGRTEAEADPPR